MVKFVGDDEDMLSVKKGTVGVACWRDRESGNHFVRWQGGLSCYVEESDIMIMTEDEKKLFLVRTVMES